jgi:hypothetical protein
MVHHGVHVQSDCVQRPADSRKRPIKLLGRQALRNRVLGTPLPTAFLVGRTYALCATSLFVGIPSRGSTDRL